VSHIRAVLRAALQRAVKWGMVSRNAAALADGPRVPERPMVSISPTDAADILVAVAGTPLEALVALTLFTGLRQGEALGLRWSDVDLDANTVRVRMALRRLRGVPGDATRLELAEPKTARSRRTVDFPPVVAEALRAHRVGQLRRRIAAGAAWREPIPDLVFTRATGGPLDGPGVTHGLQVALEAAGLPRRRFHDLRHACATLLLASGTDIAVVRDILGHSTIALTANTYAAVLPALQRDAARRLEALVSSGRRPRRTDAGGGMGGGTPPSSESTAPPSERKF
jgi:integrase